MPFPRALPSTGWGRWPLSTPGTSPGSRCRPGAPPSTVPGGHEDACVPVRSREETPEFRPQAEDTGPRSPAGPASRCPLEAARSRSTRSFREAGHRPRPRLLTPACGSAEGPAPAPPGPESSQCPCSEPRWRRWPVTGEPLGGTRPPSHRALVRAPWGAPWAESKVPELRTRLCSQPTRVLG